MLAAADSVDLARLLLDLLVVIAAAKLAAELVERTGIPAVLGEIVAGIVIGPSALGLVELGSQRGVSLGVLAEIGVLLLLVQVGMEMDLAELGRVGRASMLVAVIGVVVPFAVGAVTGLALGWSSETAIFLGAALTATSVGITARVFGDLRALATTEARIVLGAAVADDVLGLVILTIVVKIVTGDSVTVGLLVTTILAALAFLVVSGLVGLLAVPRLLDVVSRLSRSGGTLTIAALVVVLGFAIVADAAQLAFIIGAFMAGLSIGRSRHAERVAADLNSVGAVFIPVFFVLIGVNADLGAMLRPSVLFDAGVLFVIALAGKLVSMVGAAGTTSDRLLIGIGMIPRGEVGLIFASIGLASGVLDDELYGALLLVVLLSTVVTPPLLRWRIQRRGAVDVVSLDDHVTPEPAGGWVARSDGQLVLIGHPPAAEIVPVALQSAGLTDATVRPSDELLSWFGERRGVALRWTGADTWALLDVIRRGNPRAVRLLDVTGVLERGVPSLAAALARRRADPSELDPSRILRFPTVNRLEELLADAESDGRDAAPITALAALVVDIEGIDVDEPAGRRLLTELAVDDADAQRVVDVLTASRLLRRAAADVHGYSPAEVRQLATQVGSPAMAVGAHLLAMATGVDERHRDGLDELHTLVLDLLRHPEILGEGAEALAATRRAQAEALSDEPAAIARLRAAPVEYLLAHEPEELARQARLVEPLPAAKTIRVAVSPDPTPDHWLIDVACRDRDALLAHLCRALTASGCDIVAATVATWPDGAVVDSFYVRSAVRPRAKGLAQEMEDELRRRVVLEPLDGRDDHVRQRRAAVAHRRQRHRAGPPGHPRRARRRLRRHRRGRAQRPNHHRQRRPHRPLRPHRTQRAQARRASDGPRPGRARRRRPAPVLAAPLSAGVVSGTERAPDRRSHDAKSGWLPRTLAARPAGCSQSSWRPSAVRSRK